MSVFCMETGTYVGSTSPFITACMRSRGPDSSTPIFVVFAAAAVGAPCFWWLWGRDGRAGGGGAMSSLRRLAVLFTSQAESRTCPGADVRRYGLLITVGSEEA